MIDFRNAAFVTLTPTNDGDFFEWIQPMFVDGEQIIQSFRGIRDVVVFTNKRIFAINVQGVSGRKKAFTTLPYSKIQAFSFETAGTFDLDSELELWFTGLGKVTFEFAARTNISAICWIISSYIL